MVIQKNENSKWLIVVATCLFSGTLLAGDFESLNVLKESYRISNSDNSKELISKLEKAQKESESLLLRDRIQYRIGMLYFKQGDIEKASMYFAPFLSREQCDTGIQIAATNMMAQIVRFQARDNDALEYYEKLIEILIKDLNTSDEIVTNHTAGEIFISSVLGKTEIYAFQEKYHKAAEEYIRAIQVMSKSSSKKTAGFLPVLYDHLSQIHLKEGQVQQYLDVVSIILKKYKNYERAALIELESFAVQFLKEKKWWQDYTNGSIDAPSKLISFVKENKDKDTESVNKIESLFNRLSEHLANNNHWLIDYQYACFLDSIGERDESGELFSKIIDGIEAENSGYDGVTHAILNYSKLSKALMEGECKRYREGLRYIDSIDNSMYQEHIRKLSDSIHNSLEILKRELPKNENSNN